MLLDFRQKCKLGSKIGTQEVPAVAVWRIPPGPTVVDYGGIS